MESRKKILYVITKSVLGGAQRYIFDLATNLPKSQFDVAVACGGSGPLVAKLQSADIRVIAIPHLERDISAWKEIASFFSLFKILARERPDIVHLNSSKAGGLGAVAARLASLITGHKLLVVFTVHGWAFNEDRPRWQKKIIHFASWLASLFQDKLVVINAADYKAAQKFVPISKIELVYHGVKSGVVRPREEARAFFAEKLKADDNRGVIILGATAELTRNKGLDYLIEAMRQVKNKNPNAKAVIMGDGERRQELQSKIKNSNLDDTVHLAGFVPEADNILGGLDVFVMPSLKEGLPYALMEAMAAGLPVIASAVGGIPDLVKNRKNGILVPPKNSRALAEAILLAASRPELRQTLGKEAQRTIKNQFALGVMMEKTAKIYSTI